MLKLCKTAVTIKSKTTHHSWWCFLCQQNTSHKQGNTTEWWSKLVILHLDTWKPETFASQVLEDEQRSRNGQRFHWHAAIGNNGWARCQWLGHCCWWCSTNTVQAKFGSGHISWCCISHMTTRWAWFSGHNTCLGENCWPKVWSMQIAQNAANGSIITDSHSALVSGAASVSHMAHPMQLWASHLWSQHQLQALWDNAQAQTD